MRLGSNKRGRLQEGTWVFAVRILGIVVVVTVAMFGGLTLGEAERANASTNLSRPEPTTVDGVSLIPITTSQRGDCQRFAKQLKRPVPCPGLLPDPIPVSPTSPAASCLAVLGEDGCGPAVVQESAGVFLLSQSNFQVPAGYAGVTFQQNNGTVVPETSVSGGPLGHFVFMAGTDLQLYLRKEPGKHVPPVPTYCSPMKVDKAIRVHGAIATLYQCSDSAGGPGELQLIMGHDVLVWKDQGITSEVSFHGHSQVNVDLDKAVADSTTLIAPNRR